MGDEETSPANPSRRLESTAELLVRVRGGDEDAVNRILRIYMPLLQRWAHGRLPPSARGLAATEDLVQITLLRVLEHVGAFEPRHPGAFLAYLRRSLLNNLRNEIRAASRRPAGDSQATEEIADPGSSPLEQVIGARALEAYERALQELEDEHRAAVIMKIELGCGNDEIAALLGSPSANAARMVVSRALVRLAKLIHEEAADHGS